jgi:molybdopterin converting factor small subunit
MAITIVIPTALRQFAGGKTELAVEASTANEALEKLTTEFPELRKHLYADDKSLRNFINVYVGDEDIRHLSGLATPLKPGESVLIVPSIAGGNSVAEARTADQYDTCSHTSFAVMMRSS